MMEKITDWLKHRFSNKKPEVKDARKATYARKGASGTAPPRVSKDERTLVEIDPEVKGKIESAGPGKNVLIRNRFVREETGTHETLKIVDDSIIETGEEPGIDPYNTGGFDRSKKWDQRFRK